LPRIERGRQRKGGNKLIGPRGKATAGKTIPTIEGISVWGEGLGEKRGPYGAPPAKVSYTSSKKKEESCLKPFVGRKIEKKHKRPPTIDSYGSEGSRYAQEEPSYLNIEE